MKKLQGILLVVFLLIVVIFSVSSLWNDGSEGKEGSKIERNLDDWIPLMP